MYTNDEGDVLEPGLFVQARGNTTGLLDLPTIIVVAFYPPFFIVICFPTLEMSVFYIFIWITFLL